MYTSKVKLIAISAALLLAAGSCKKKDDPVNPTPPTSSNQTGKVGFEVSNYAGTAPLVLNTGAYTTTAGESISVSMFSYYISNIKLKREDGTEFAETESYHLVKADDGASKHFHLKDVPAGTYTSVTFMIGVDSLRNVSGAQTGALDPDKGMFWTWNTGYIMAKMEGSSPQSSAADKKFIHHIGGYMGDNRGQRVVTISFPQKMILTNGTEGTIAMRADALKWFSGSSQISVAAVSNLMSVNATSKSIADNYASMFSITGVVVAME